MQNYYQDTTNDRFPVGMAYIPWQKIDKIYESLSEAFCEGTLFPELNRPYTGRRCKEK